MCAHAKFIAFGITEGIGCVPMQNLFFLAELKALGPCPYNIYCFWHNRILWFPSGWLFNPDRQSCTIGPVLHNTQTHCPSRAGCAGTDCAGLGNSPHTWATSMPDMQALALGGTSDIPPSAPPVQELSHGAARAHVGYFHTGNGGGGGGGRPRRLKGRRRRCSRHPGAHKSEC